jgi:hypothetical protein
MSESEPKIQTEIEYKQGIPKNEVIVIIIICVMLSGIIFNYNTKGSNFGTNLIVGSVGAYIIYDAYCKHSTQRVQTIVVNK